MSELEVSLLLASVGLIIGLSVKALVKVRSSRQSDKMRYCALCGTELVCFDRYEHGGPKPGCPKCGRLHEDIILSTKQRTEVTE